MKTIKQNKYTIVLLVIALLIYGGSHYIARSASGAQVIEFRATQTTNAAFYPSSGNLSTVGIEICAKNDDDADSIYIRTDGTAADASEANCDTVGCHAFLLKPGEYTCRIQDIVRLSVDASGNAPFRAWIKRY